MTFELSAWCKKNSSTTPSIVLFLKDITCQGEIDTPSNVISLITCQLPFSPNVKQQIFLLHGPGGGGVNAHIRLAQGGYPRDFTTIHSFIYQFELMLTRLHVIVVPKFNMDVEMAQFYFGACSIKNKKCCK